MSSQCACLLVLLCTLLFSVAMTTLTPKKNCPALHCPKYCLRGGYATHPKTGCKICKCKLPGDTRCRVLKCMLGCKFGYKKDPKNGCDLCQCNKKPKCPSLKYCRAKFTCRYGLATDPITKCEVCSCGYPIYK